MDGNNGWHDWIIMGDYNGENNFKIPHTNLVFFSKPLILYKYSEKMDVKKIFSFKVLDNFMEEYQKNVSTFTDLYNQKVKLLTLIDQGKINAKIYHQACQKLMNETDNEEIKSNIDFELMDLTDDVDSWFNDIVEQTKEKAEEQKKLLQRFNKKQPSVQKKQIQKPPTSIKENQAKHAIVNFDPSKIFCFKALDRLIEDNKTTKPELFMLAFQQKQKIIQIMKAGRLNAKAYLKAVLTSLQQFSNDQQISFNIQMEVDSFKEFHDGNVDSWFQEVVNETGEEYQSQLEFYNAVKNGKKPVMKKQKSSSYGADVSLNQDVDILIQGSVKHFESKLNVESPKKDLDSKEQSNCFRYLDEQMSAIKDDPQKREHFCKLFESKQRLLQSIKRGQIDGVNYKKSLQKIIGKTSKYRCQYFSEQLKQAAEMELDLHDITGDIMEFFQGVIEDTGSHYEQQQKIFKQYGGKPISLQNVQNHRGQSQIPEDPKPQISDIVSFTVLVELIQKYKRNYDYCLELKEKGQKLLDLVDAKRLNITAYVKFLENKIASSANQFIVSVMKKEMRTISKAKNQQKCFKQIVGSYLDKVKISFKRSASSGMQIDERTINKASAETKIQYLLRKLAIYESLLTYYKNNKIVDLAKDFKPEYEAKKKQVFLLCEKIKNGDAEDIDVREFVQDNIHPISFGVLNRESKSSYDEKIDQYIEKLLKSRAQYQQYSKKLKKSANKKNIENSQKEMQSINESIEYLKKLKSLENTPLPLLQQEKKEMYNLDINEELDDNQIKIGVTKIEGIRDTLTLKIYFYDHKSHRYEANVSEGMQKNIQTTLKISPNIMQNVIKGTDDKYVKFTLSSKGWFSESVVGSGATDLNFIRTNVMEDKLEIKEGKIWLYYLMKVKKPKRPLVTEVLTYKMTKYPAYSHNKEIEEEFLKTILQTSKPTKSELR